MTDLFSFLFFIDNLFEGLFISIDIIFVFTDSIGTNIFTYNFVPSELLMRLELYFLKNKVFTIRFYFFGFTIFFVLMDHFQGKMFLSLVFGFIEGHFLSHVEDIYLVRIQQFFCQGIQENQFTQNISDIQLQLYFLTTIHILLRLSPLRRTFEHLEGTHHIGSYII